MTKHEKPNSKQADQFAWLRQGAGPQPQKIDPREVVLDLDSQKFLNPSTGIALRICDWMDGRDLRVFVDDLQVGRIASGERRLFAAQAGTRKVHVIQDWLGSAPLEVKVVEGTITELACYDNRFTFPLFWWVNLAMMMLNPRETFRLENASAEKAAQVVNIDVSALVRDLSLGKQILCKNCLKPLKLKLAGSGHQPGVYCKNGCTSILIEAERHPK